MSFSGATVTELYSQQLVSLQTHGPWHLLTTRETEIITLVMRGCKNKDIALRTGITTHTVKIYISRLFLRVGVKTRTELAYWGFLFAPPSVVSEIKEEYARKSGQLSRFLHNGTHPLEGSEGRVA